VAGLPATISSTPKTVLDVNIDDVFPLKIQDGNGLALYCVATWERITWSVGLGKLAGRLQREQPHYGAYPIGFSHSFPTRPLGGRRYIRASILKRNAALVLLVDCLRQRLAVWAWKLAVCQRPT
jgi:hypothetical protein